MKTTHRTRTRITFLKKKRSTATIQRKKTKIVEPTIFDLSSAKLWVSASTTRNYAIGDPILDWLEMYGEEKGYQRDSSKSAELDFSAFVMRKGHQFEEHVINYIRSLFSGSVATIGGGHDDSKYINKFRDTVAAMKRGVPFIYQGVLHNSENYTYGSPDLIVRSDYLEHLVKTAPIQNDAKCVGCAFSDNWHYRIVDIKYTTLNLNVSDSRLQNSGSLAAYKAQLAIYNDALALAQGYRAPEAFILGRAWKTRRASGDSAFEMLGRIDYAGKDCHHRECAVAATEWIRRLRRCGHRWNPISRRNGGLPSVPELYPNMCNSESGAFHGAKKRIAKAIGEITLLWNCGTSQRESAHAHGKYSLSEISADDLELSDRFSDTISMILDVNSEKTDTALSSRYFSNDIDAWQTADPENDFFVDFETVSNVNDDFSTFPKRGGGDMIWMIGCEYYDTDTDSRQFVQFIAENLRPKEESRIISDWLSFLKARSAHPRIFHWSSAEPSMLNAAAARNPKLGRKLGSLDWIDMCRVFISEPIVIRGAYNFKLKEVARAFKEHGYIKTEWQDNDVDGLGSSVAAWSTDNAGTRLPDAAIIHEVAEYNRVDCAVVFEIVDFLRNFSD